MPIDADTAVVRINLAQADLNLDEAIKETCGIQASRDKHRRLVAAFESQNQLILVFQHTPN